MNIRVIGDIALKKVAEPVQEVNREIIEFATEMIKIMIANGGIGLAAPQLGINKKLIIVSCGISNQNVSTPITEGEAFLIPKMPILLINPEILCYSDSQVKYEEGCLSIPKVYAEVVRSSEVMVKMRLVNGEEICMECGGLLSVVLQHEIDHLNGILFVDRLTHGQFDKIKPKINTIKAKYHQ